MASGTLEAFPAKLQPMTAQLAQAAFADPAWLFEPKLDGYRMLAFLRAGELRLVSRRGIDYTRQFPSIGAALKALTEKDCFFDGEIIALAPDGKPSFNALQNRAGVVSDVEIGAVERRRLSSSASISSIAPAATSAGCPTSSADHCSRP